MFAFIESIANSRHELLEFVFISHSKTFAICEVHAKSQLFSSLQYCKYGIDYGLKYDHFK